MATAERIEQAHELVGQYVRFRSEPNMEPVKVIEASSDGMVTLDKPFVGEFAPHLFESVNFVGDGGPLPTDRRQRLRDLCHELNEAENQLAQEMSRAHDEGYTVDLSGTFCHREIFVYGPSHERVSSEGSS